MMRYYGPLTDVEDLLPTGSSYADELAATPAPLHCPLGRVEDRHHTSLLIRLLRARISEILDTRPCMHCAGQHLDALFAQYEHPLTRNIEGAGTTMAYEWLWSTALYLFPGAAAGRTLTGLTDAWDEAVAGGYGVACANPGCRSNGSHPLDVLLDYGHTLLAAAAFSAYRDAWDEAFGAQEQELINNAAARGFDPFEDPDTLQACAALAIRPAPGVPADWATFGQLYGWDASDSEVQDAVELDDIQMATLEVVLGGWLRG